MQTSEVASAPAGASPPAVEGDTRGSHVRRALPWVGLALVLLPFLWSAIVLLVIGGRFHSVSDVALTELRVRDIGRHSPLVGPFSRDDWNHPGPALFYLLAIPYRLVGSNSIGLYIGAIGINVGSIVGMVIIAKRHGGTALMMLTLVGCAFVERALGGAFFATRGIRTSRCCRSGCCCSSPGPLRSVTYGRCRSRSGSRVSARKRTSCTCCWRSHCSSGASGRSCCFSRPTTGRRMHRPVRSGRRRLLLPR